MPARAPAWGWWVVSGEEEELGLGTGFAYEEGASVGVSDFRGRGW